MTDTTTPDQLGPYARAARLYRAAGWVGVLPVTGKDVNLPKGYTGYHGRWPTEFDVGTWIAQRGHDNVALRAPSDVIGIDVDAYDGKQGLATLALLEQDYGQLPPTWTSTSRTDDSGIRWYRVPSELEWISDLGSGSGVEIVRNHHRYGVVWPSVHPITGREYRWYTPEARLSERVPSPTEFAELPPSLVGALRLDGLAAARRGRRGGHAGDSIRITDLQGEPVDPHAVLSEGLPIGSQQNELFRYVCSMRTRRMHRDEAIALGMIALQRMENKVDREEWTPQHITSLVDRVWNEYPPGGGLLDLAPELRAFAERVAQTTVERDVTTGGAQVVEPERDARATDLGNTVRFVALHRERARYAVDLKRWYVWDGRRWAPDELNRALDLTKDVVDAVRLEAALAEDNDGRDRWLAWAHQSEALARRKAIVDGAQSEPALVTTSEAFDTDPHLLVVRNGTVDLRTGALRASVPADLCSHLAEVDYQPDATCPRWEAHVNMMCKDDPALIAYLRRAVGYTLTGDVGERNFFFLEGTGSNGKNAFVEPIMQLLGSYAQAVSTALLTGGDEQHPTILADLMGTRLAFVDETRANKQLNVERLKALTGSKRVKARFMKQNFFEFDARFKLWIAGNGQPKISDPSDGVWTRMHRVICHGKVDENQKIKGYGDLLYAEEASGILNWALEGLADWRQLGSLGVPESVRLDVQSYRDEEDYVGQFIDECLLQTDEYADVVSIDAVFLAWQSWAVMAGLRGADLLNKVYLSRALAAHGLKTSVRRVGTRTVRALSGYKINNGVRDDA